MKMIFSPSCRSIDNNAATTFKAQKSSKNVIKILRDTSGLTILLWR